MIVTNFDNDRLPEIARLALMMYCGHIGWVSSKVITGVINLGSSRLGAPTSAIQSKGTPQNYGGIMVGCRFQQKTRAVGSRF